MVREKVGRHGGEARCCLTVMRWRGRSDRRWETLSNLRAKVKRVKLMAFIVQYSGDLGDRNQFIAIQHVNTITTGGQPS